MKLKEVDEGSNRSCSNLENRKLNLDIAITQLENLLQDIKVSPYIETKPVGGPIQDDSLMP